MTIACVCEPLPAVSFYYRLSTLGSKTTVLKLLFCLQVVELESDPQYAHQQVKRLEPLAAAKREKLKDEMLGMWVVIVVIVGCRS